jgi:hypothetical protein
VKQGKEMGDHNDVEECLEHEEILTDWEIDFLNSLLEWENDFTERQDDVLERILLKVRRRFG